MLECEPLSCVQGSEHLRGQVLAAGPPLPLTHQDGSQPGEVSRVARRRRRIDNSLFTVSTKSEKFPDIWYSEVADQTYKLGNFPKYISFNQLL